MTIKATNHRFVWPTNINNTKKWWRIRTFILLRSLFYHFHFNCNFTFASFISDCNWFTSFVIYKLFVLHSLFIPWPFSVSYSFSFTNTFSLIHGYNPSYQSTSHFLQPSVGRLGAQNRFQVPPSVVPSPKAGHSRHCHCLDYHHVTVSGLYHFPYRPAPPCNWGLRPSTATVHPIYLIFRWC